MVEMSQLGIFEMIVITQELAGFVTIRTNCGHRNVCICSCLPVWPLDRLSCLLSVPSSLHYQKSPTRHTQKLPLFVHKFTMIIIICSNLLSDIYVLVQRMHIYVINTLSVVFKSKAVKESNNK